MELLDKNRISREVVRNECVEQTSKLGYDGFGQELQVGDNVVLATSRWTGDYCLMIGKVVSFTKKTTTVEIIEVSYNSDKPVADTYIGCTRRCKPDKLMKLK
jgi:hypothetical protein